MEEEFEEVRQLMRQVDQLIDNILKKCEDNSKPSTSTEHNSPSDQSQTCCDTSGSSVLPLLEDSYDNQQQEQSASTSKDTVEAIIKKKDFLNRFQTFNRRRGTRDQGREFEQIMCAYYALKLASSKDVDDFEMTSNNAKDGKFDDIDIKVTYKSGASRRFLFQLKHKERKTINPKQLEKSGFSFKDYIKSISEMNVNEDTVFILFTNSSMKTKSSTIKLKDEINIETCTELETVEFFVNTDNTNDKSNSVFEIRTKNLEEKFYFFTSQLDVKQSEEKVNATLRRLLRCKIYDAFTSYMRSWWSGRFVLTKHDVLAKITELALSPYCKKLSYDNSNNKTKSVIEAIMSFSLTIVEESEGNSIGSIWGIKKTWTDDEFSKAKDKYGLKEHQNRVLWYLGKLPLVVNYDDSNEEIIGCVLSLLGKDIGDKKIVLCGTIPKTNFEVDTLKNLSDLITKRGGNQYLSQIMKTFKISLQDRQSTTLEDLTKNDPGFAKLIRLRDLLKMSQQEHLLVGSQKKELPDFHIPRTISPVFVKTEEILNFHKSSLDSLIIINCDQEFVTKLSQDNINTIELSQYSTTEVNEDLNAVILSTKNKCNHFQFEELFAKFGKPNAYLFQYFNQEHCILMLQKGRKLELEFTVKAVKENEILVHYDNPLHVFCAPPGMGKSTLMKVLYNTCPSDRVAVHVKLIHHNSFLEEKPAFEAILDRFLQTNETEDDLLKRMMEHFKQQQKLYMLLDGLDEVNSQYVESILNFAKLASSEGVKVWISSRENLREILCQRLNVVPINIEELNEEEQKAYIECRLKGMYSTEEIENITNAVFNSTHLNSSKNLLGIPLQLHIITEVFLHDKSVYGNLKQRNIFVLPQMYTLFFEGKIKFAMDKFLDKNLQTQLGYLKHVLQAYEIPALKTCLDKQDLKLLNLDLDTKEVNEFLNELRTQGDKYGIIKSVNQNNEAVFVHQTYAEYFTCVWLKKHLDRAKLLKCKLFTKKYANIRLMFDILLAENNPLHLSIIYKDIEQFRKHIDEIGSRDEAGRTVYHLAFSYGQKYRPVSNTKDDNIIELETLERETSFYETLIEELLKNGEIPKEKDLLFDLDCVCYASLSGCWYPIEKLIKEKRLTLRKREEPLDHHSHDRMALAYCAAQCGYPNFLSELIKKSGRLVNNKEALKGLMQRAIRGCNGDLYTPPRQGNVEAVKIIIEETDPQDLDYILEEARINKSFDVLKTLSTETMRSVHATRCPTL